MAGLQFCPSEHLIPFLPLSLVSSLPSPSLPVPDVVKARYNDTDDDCCLQIYRVVGGGGMSANYPHVAMRRLAIKASGTSR